MNKKRVFDKGKIFHICNKSIANYGIFKDKINSIRFIKALFYYNNVKNKRKLSNYFKLKKLKEKEYNLLNLRVENKFKCLAYCIMPDHYHLLIKVLTDYSLSKYISDAENSFSRYFNIKFKRKGPIWQSRFRSVEVKTDEQLLHVSRYIHLNPVTDYLVERPEDWPLSSYRDYIYNSYYLKELFSEITITNSEQYKKFCEDQIDYQRNLKKIKKLLLE
ncbi:MAG: transposase [Patescibacteria group bacterium]